MLDMRVYEVSLLVPYLVAGHGVRCNTSSVLQYAVTLQAYL
jgi:hypothetical protein